MNSVYEFFRRKVVDSRHLTHVGSKVAQHFLEAGSLQPYLAPDWLLFSRNSKVRFLKSPDDVDVEASLKLVDRL